MSNGTCDFNMFQSIIPDFKSWQEEGSPDDSQNNVIDCKQEETQLESLQGVINFLLKEFLSIENILDEQDHHQIPEDITPLLPSISYEWVDVESPKPPMYVKHLKRYPFMILQNSLYIFIFKIY